MPALKYGRPMEGQLLEEWVHHAGQHPENWYTAEEHHEAAVRFAARMARTPKKSAPFKSVIIEGEPGAGKSRIANYVATLMAVSFGSQVYTDIGTFFYGIAFDDAEMLGAFNFLERGAVFFMDEANQYDRMGRDNSIIGELRASHYQVVRKNQCFIINASANSDRMSRGTRSRCDEWWHPEKLKVAFSEDAKKRLGRKGQGQGPRGRNNPSNHAFAVLKALDQPHRPRSMFDAALGKERDPKAGVPIYRNVLSVAWMRKVTPLFNSFKPVSVGAAQSADNEDVLAIAQGKAPSFVNGVSQTYLEVVVALYKAFWDNRLPTPVQSGGDGIYQPKYWRSGEILAKIDHPIGGQKFSQILIDDLGVPSVRGRGYELGELYEAVSEALADDAIRPQLERMINGGDDAPFD